MPMDNIVFWVLPFGVGQVSGGELLSFASKGRRDEGREAKSVWMEGIIQ